MNNKYSHVNRLVRLQKAETLDFWLSSLKVGDKVRSGNKTRDPPTRPQKIRAVPPRKVRLTHFAR